MPIRHSSFVIRHPLRIGARGSRLAQIQAQEVAEAIRRINPGIKIEVVAIRTTGDRDRRTALAQIGQKGIFTREIQDALLRGEIDLAVHSLKDLPAEEVPGLTLAAVLPRQDPRDAWISLRFASPFDLPEGGCIGTSSLRREAFLRHHRPDLQIVPLRGNVETRLRRLREQGIASAASHDSAAPNAPRSTPHAPRLMGGIILAAAGLLRLGLEAEITAFLGPPEWLPAPGQGAIALECRSPALSAVEGDDASTLALVSQADDPDTRACVEAERALLRAVEGGCQVPLGALAQITGGRLHLTVALLSRDGSQMIQAQGEGSSVKAAEVGQQVGADMLAQGGKAIVEAIRVASGE